VPPSAQSGTVTVRRRRILTFRLLAVCWPGKESIGDNHVIAILLVTLRNIHRFKKITHRLSNKPFLICLLKTSPYLKYVATLPCNLSLMVCFADINVSQGSVATHARCGGIFNIYLTANLLGNHPVTFFNRLRSDRSIVMS